MGWLKYLYFGFAFYIGIRPISLRPVTKATKSDQKVTTTRQKSDLTVLQKKGLSRTEMRRMMLIGLFVGNVKILAKVIETT